MVAQRVLSVYVDVGGCWGLQGGVGCQIGISSYFQSREKLKPDGKGNLIQWKKRSEGRYTSVQGFVGD